MKKIKAWYNGLEDGDWKKGAFWAVLFIAGVLICSGIINLFV